MHGGGGGPPETPKLYYVIYEHCSLNSPLPQQNHAGITTDLLIWQIVWQEGAVLLSWTGSCYDQNETPLIQCTASDDKWSADVVGLWSVVRAGA